MSAQSDVPADHPSPARHKARPLALLFGLAAAPLAWAIQSVVGYSLSSYSCYPADVPLRSPVLAHVEPLLATLNVAALALGGLGAAIAWRTWRNTRHESGGSTQQLLEVGEGRTRFLAMCGICASGGFLVATLFSSIALALSPLCR